MGMLFGVWPMFEESLAKPLAIQLSGKPMSEA